MIFPYGAMINWFAVNAPVDGLNFNLVDDTVCGRLPVVLLTKVG
jgi:hypothetical protein